MKNINSTNLVSLRQMAEERIEINYPDKDKLLIHHNGEADQLKLLHELQVHEVELEMQNEELKLAIHKAETATTLYDFAPTGYFTLHHDGNVKQLNLSGAKMLGRERFNLIDTNFKQFVPRESQLAFINFFRNIFDTQCKQTCELRLMTDPDTWIYVHLEGIIAEDENQCLVTAVDISERKKWEEAIRQKESNLNGLVNNRDESIWSIDQKYHLIIYNNFFRDECFASYNVELKNGMNALSFLPSHLSHLWKQKYDKALLGRRVIFEYSNQVEEDLHFYEVFLNPIILEGQVTGVTALSSVITWRKQTEEALRQSEERHRLLADNALDVIWTMDLEGHLTYVSPSVKRLNGYSVAEMMKHSIEEILTGESAANAQSAIQEAHTAMKAGQAIREFHMELEQNCKNGSTVWTDTTASSMFNAEGEFVGVIGVTRNIAKRKRAELALRNSEIKYRKLYESIIDGFATIDMKGQFVDCNHSFEQLLGYSRQELCQLSLTDITDKKWHAHEKYIIEEQLIPNGYSQLFETEFIRKNGTIVPVEISAFVIKNEMGENVQMCAIVRDITENKRKQEVVIKSELLYHAIFEKSSAAMFLIDPADGAIVDANSASCQFYGYGREQFKELKIMDINMLSLEQVKASMAETELGKRLYFNFRHKLADSQLREVEVYACPIEIEGRTLLHSIVHDITDRKMAEEALAASEIRFRSLLQNVSSVAVQGYSPDGRIQYWNHASEQLYGYTAQEAIGRNLVKLIVPADYQSYVNQSILEMVATGQPLRPSESSLMRRNGSRVEVFTSHAIVQMPGRAPELFCFDIDLTDRKRAEEEVRERDAIFTQMLENSPIYIFFKDDKTRMLSLSRNYEDRLGKKMEEMIGKTVDELFPAETAIRMRESDLLCMKEGLKIETEEEINGRHFSILKFPIQIQGKPTLLAGFSIDITERKRAEMALKESEMRWQELNATKDKFFSIISHDLKSPFNSIIGFSNLLSRQLQEKDYDGIGKYAMIIQHSSQRAMNLLMNLLEWSRSQTGNLEFHPEKVELSVLIREAIDLLIDAAQYKSINIDLQIQPNTQVMADRLMFGTIVRNLVSNAIKFTHPGGEIVISSRQDQDQCIVTVADNGVGIRKDALDKLFRIDVSYSTVGTQDEVGTGLGLILCKDFVERHRGKIWVESERSGCHGTKNGSQFHFSIPLAVNQSLNAETETAHN
ncbi:MAG TPA: PAS domain-containing sensor histidine kinase [Prolixibacteraceae bacterium]|jgi:PAS domain S-box-containing protein